MSAPWVMVETMPAMNFEVVIVGAGPVGLTAANLLGQYGIKTLVLERDASMASYPRATNVDDEALRTFQIFGLAERQLADMLPNPYVRIQSAKGGVVAELQASDAGSLGFPRVCTILQPVMEAHLKEGLKRFASVELRAGHEVTGLSCSDGGSVATVRGPDDESYEVEAGFVLGCDGGRSTVRKLCGILLQGATSEEKWLLIEARAEPRSEGCFRFFGALVHPMVFVQQPRGYQRWSIRLRPEDDAEHFERLDSGGLEALVSRWVNGPRLGEVTRQRTYRINTCIAERFREGRVFLLGDSAHMMPPFAGQGLCSGLRDAANICWKLALVLRGDVSSRLLDSYELERIGHVEESVAATERIGWLFFPRSRRHDVVRRSMLKALFTLPPLRKQFIQRSKALPRLRQGLFAGRAPAGSMLIQPHVLRADGQRVLLDTVLGDGFAAIGLGMDPLAAMEGDSRRFWLQLGMRSIQIVPKGHQPWQAGPGSCEGVQDEEGGLTRWFKKHQGDVAFIRPDRFVAAFFSLRQAEPAHRLRGMLDA